MNNKIHKVYMNSNNEVIQDPTLPKKPNIDHFVIQLNTKGHIHKDKKKVIYRKRKYKKPLAKGDE
jgi:hypothetical protein